MTEARSDPRVPGTIMAAVEESRRACVSPTLSHGKSGEKALRQGTSTSSKDELTKCRKTP